MPEGRAQAGTELGHTAADILWAQLSTVRCIFSQAAGVRTKVGTWALSEAEAAMIELSADRDEKWEASLAGKEQWLHKPLQPPGLLRSGTHHTHHFSSWTETDRTLGKPGLLRL